MIFPFVVSQLSGHIITGVDKIDCKTVIIQSESPKDEAQNHHKLDHLTGYLNNEPPCGGYVYPFRVKGCDKQTSICWQTGCKIT